MPSPQDGLVSRTPISSIRSSLELLKSPTLQRLYRTRWQFSVRAVEPQPVDLNRLRLIRTLFHDPDSSSRQLPGS